MIYTDHKGALGQYQPRDNSVEYGDSACWTGHWIYLKGYHYEDLPITYFETGFGRYVRHPNPKSTNNGFGAVHQCMSRDQYTGILAAIISQKAYAAAYRALYIRAKRLFLFAYNTIHNGVDPKTAKWKMPDITLFDIWAMEIRGLGDLTYILYPLLIILDIHMLLNTIIFNLFDKDEDQINFAIKHFVQRDHFPTPLSWLAWYLLDKPKLIRLITSYWSGWRDMPEMVKLYSGRLK